MITELFIKSKTKVLLFLLLSLFFSGFSQNVFQHDYSQTLVMKLLMSVPDGRGGTKVSNTVETAIDIIKKVDYLSLGAPKIIYLVGWQYNGHDDKYPAFFKVNEALKRPQDTNARESLLWLIKEAKKYHTTVSLHINMTDAYEDSPLWKEYVAKDMISKTSDGKLMVIGNYNNRKAYQINYKNEWEKGYAQMRIDKLLELLPSLKEGGTIHLDAWIARASKGHYESAIIEAEYQKKVLNYWKSKGIDVTSEWVMDYMVGWVPFAWHFNYMTQEDYLQIPAKIYTGSGLNPHLRNTDFALGFLFGTSMYGEPYFPSLLKPEDSKNWISKFNKDFYLNTLQYFYLNTLKRLKVIGEGQDRVAYFSDDVTTSLKDSTVTQKDFQLRKKNFVIFPVLWKSGKYLAVYSQDKDIHHLHLPTDWSDVKKVFVYKITSSGNKLIQEVPVNKLKMTLKLKAKTPYLLKPATYNK